MTPDEHAERAEYLLRIVDDTYEGADQQNRRLNPVDVADLTMIATIAQAHATLSMRKIDPPTTPAFQDGPAGSPEVGITAADSALNHKPDFETQRRAGFVPTYEIDDLDDEAR
jgi:hypothetical protein